MGAEAPKELFRKREVDSKKGWKALFFFDVAEYCFVDVGFVILCYISIYMYVYDSSAHYYSYHFICALQIIFVLWFKHSFRLF